MSKKHQQDEEPSIAAGLETNDALREEATEEEVRNGDYTEVTHFVIDRTPDDEA